MEFQFILLAVAINVQSVALFIMSRRVRNLERKLYGD